MPTKQFAPFNSPNLYSAPGFFFNADDTGNGSHTNDDENNADGGGNSGQSQKEIDRQFAERASRAKEAERKRLLESLGVGSEDDLKAIVQAKREADEKSKTELQKLADKATAAEAEKVRLQAEADQKLAEMQKRVLDTEIKLAASQPVKDKEGKVTRAAFRPEAMDAVLALVERGEIAEKEGKYEGVDKALEKLAKAHPYMLAEAQQADPKGTPGAGKGRFAKSAGSQKSDDDFGGIGFDSL